jgi:mRNA-degrading endonuclease RelE of RelBE toxin-antitoxin system
MFEILFSPEALDDLHALRKYDQERIRVAIRTRLGGQPSQGARNRKRLRPNPLAEWELRVGGFRVFYDIESEQKRVKIKAVGYKKGSKLYVHGEEYRL